MLKIKGNVLHHMVLHLKVSGWLSDLNALLTRKLPMFLPRLNERGSRGNTCLLSGSLRKNFEVFDWKVLWMIGEGEWNSFGFLVFSEIYRSISGVSCLPVVTAKSGWLRFLKNWHISSHLSLKSVSSLQRRLSLTN